MASSPLDPSNPPRKPEPGIGRGHGVRDLGPSDSSDSGSDMIGARGAEGDEENLDSDSDRNGTGETASASDARPTDGADISPDHIEKISADGEPREIGDEDDEDEKKAAERR
jgi:hypothetical protein